MIEKFGINAGKVWRVIDEQGRLNIKDVKKKINLADRDLYAALGWLGREDKIILEVEGKDIYISLS